MTTPYLTSIHRATKAGVLASAGRSLAIPKPTAEKPLIISASELRDFLRCRVKWWWRHQCRLQPKSGTEALAIGSLTHKILEGWYSYRAKQRTTKRMKTVAAARVAGTTLKQLTTENLALVRAMTEGYAAWAIPRDAEIGLDTCTPELEFTLPLVKDKSILVRGRMDNVFEPTTFKRVVGMHEFKTKGQIRVDVVEMNLQLTVYLWALRQLYPKAKRYVAYYNVLRKQLPGPRVRSELFHREAVERTDDQIDQWAKDTARAALDMLDPAIYPHPSDQCSWDCDFRNPCLLRGSPGDLKHVLSTEYETKERR